MKTKLSYGLIATIIVLAIIIFAVTAAGTPKVKAYNAQSRYANNRLEGFSTKSQGQDRVRYQAYPSGDDVNVENQHLIDSSADAKTAQRVKQQDGLYGPYNDKKITTFSDAKGSLAEQCAKTSNSMSNSMGYLCLDRNQLNLLTTRGGNQTCSTCVTCSKSCGCK